MKRGATAGQHAKTPGSGRAEHGAFIFGHDGSMENAQESAGYSEYVTRFQEPVSLEPPRLNVYISGK